jgi:hypothetical protein
LKRVFEQAIAVKPKRHRAEILQRGKCIRPMSTIGG